MFFFVVLQFYHTFIIVTIIKTFYVKFYFIVYTCTIHITGVPKIRPSPKPTPGQL